MPSWAGGAGRRRSWRRALMMLAFLLQVVGLGAARRRRGARRRADVHVHPVRAAVVAGAVRARVRERQRRRDSARRWSAGTRPARTRAPPPPSRSPSGGSWRTTAGARSCSASSPAASCARLGGVRVFFDAVARHGVRRARRHARATHLRAAARRRRARLLRLAAPGRPGGRRARRDGVRRPDLPGVVRHSRLHDPHRPDPVGRRVPSSTCCCAAACTWPHARRWRPASSSA